MKPMFAHEMEQGGTFLGTIRTLAGTMMDLWVCDDIMGKTLVARYGNNPEDYSSSVLPKLNPSESTVDALAEHRGMALGITLTTEIMFN